MGLNISSVVIVMVAVIIVAAVILVIKSIGVSVVQFIFVGTTYVSRVVVFRNLLVWAILVLEIWVILVLEIWAILVLEIRVVVLVILYCTRG